LLADFFKKKFFSCSFLKKRTKKLLFVLAFTPGRSVGLDCHDKKMPNAIARVQGQSPWPLTG
jgi:hypothetical protein